MLAKLLKKSRIDHIVSGFHKTLDQLAELQQTNNGEIDYHQRSIDESTFKTAGLIAENNRASQIHSNIKKLLEAA